MTEEQTNQPQPIIIPVNKVSASFGTHLGQPNNKRILFSAPFGAGKSFFLNEYFEGNEEILSIRLHPVDYSVANNEDIFELMKHDIINALIEKYGDSLKLDKSDFSDLLLAQEFIRNRMDFSGIGKAIVSAFIPHGEEIVKVGEEIQKLKEGFDDFKTEINADQEKEIKAYLSELKSKKGSIRENDAITVIIKDYIKRIKEANENKPFVFILDDLDRLDPEHLFRLFNVFTAHHDSKTDSNKFDFDQLIFVCDVKNIHHMFRHKYGKKVDFSGYIDKFYSSHIFYFDFKAFLKSSVKKILMSKYDFDKEQKDMAEAYLYKRYDFKSTTNASNWGDILNHLIGEFIDHDLIKIRSFERFQCYCIPSYEFEYKSGRKLRADNYYYLVLTYLLQQFFPRHYEYEKALEVLSNNYDADYEPIIGNAHWHDDEMVNSGLIQIAIPFLMESEIIFGNRLEPTDDSYFEFQNEKGQLLEIHYSLSYDGVIKYKSTKIAQVSEPEETKVEETRTPAKEPKTVPQSISIKRPNPYWFLLSAFKICQKRGFLKP